MKNLLFLNEKQLKSERNKIYVFFLENNKFSDMMTSQTRFAFSLKDLKEVKGKDIALLVSPSKMRKYLEKIGYTIDEEGFIIDKETGKRVKAEDGEEINIDEDREFAIISGTHTFIRNVAGYSHLLTKKGLVKIEGKKEE